MSGLVVTVVAAGEVAADSTRWAGYVDRGDVVVAADGGLVHCSQTGRQPDYIVGDLDSAPAELVHQAREAGATVRAYPPDKDHSDLELAMELALELGATEITLVGLFGGWVDHQLANLAVVTGARWAPVRIDAQDGIRSLWVVRDRVELSLPVDTTLSLLAWGGDAVGVDATGLAWPLADDTLRAATARGVSNVCTHRTQSIAVQSGTLLVIATTRR